MRNVVIVSKATEDSEEHSSPSICGHELIFLLLILHTSVFLVNSEIFMGFWFGRDAESAHMSDNIGAVVYPGGGGSRVGCSAWLTKKWKELKKEMEDKKKKEHGLCAYFYIWMLCLHTDLPAGSPACQNVRQYRCSLLLNYNHYNTKVSGKFVSYWSVVLYKKTIMY